MTTNITIPTEITNREDIIDSRDVIERIEYLEADHEDCDTYQSAIGDIEDREDHDIDEHNEVVALKALAEEADGYAPDWQYGETLIRETYFETYAEGVAVDIGAIDPKAAWPLTFIDWKAASEALQMDYTLVDFDGVGYWIR